MILAVGAVYAYIGVEQAVKGHPWMSVVYFGYAFSNVGLWKLATLNIG